MDKIGATPQPDYILQRLNAVRLSLKVSRLSDIVNEEGTHIENWALYAPPASINLS